MISTQNKSFASVVKAAKATKVVMRHRSGLAVLSCSLLLAGCQMFDGHSSTDATAQILPRSGSTVQGEMHFVKMKKTLRADLMLTGLAPFSVHGVHIHANGDCSAADASSAGGHFNPHNKMHSGPMQKGHLGDLPNVTADADGRVRVTFMLDHVSLNTGMDSDIQGRSVVVHDSADDYTSQPAGNSGKRIACGVIRR